MVTQSPMELFDGVMLGDASLCCPYNYAFFKLDCSTSGLATGELLEYLRHVREALRALGVAPSPGHPRVHKGCSQGKPYFYCRLRTLTAPFLTIQHEKWYPGGVKEVPEDLVLTPTTIAHWFMGDGTSTADKKYPTISNSLATQSYSVHSVELLERQLHALGLNTGRTHVRISKGLGIKITIRQNAIDSFMGMIDPYVTEPYRYKVKYRS